MEALKFSSLPERGSGPGLTRSRKSNSRDPIFLKPDCAGVNGQRVNFPFQFPCSITVPVRTKVSFKQFRQPFLGIQIIAASLSVLRTDYRSTCFLQYFQHFPVRADFSIHSPNIDSREIYIYFHSEGVLHCLTALSAFLKSKSLFVKYILRSPWVHAARLAV